MRILNISKFYPFDVSDSQQSGHRYSYGGIEALMGSTSSLLKAHGHDVIYYCMSHPENLTCETSEYFMPYVNLDAKHGLATQLKIAGKVLYSFEARRRLSKLLDKYPVDVVHMHNIYHSISPSVIHELKKRGIPMVMSLHDYKLVCGSYLLLIRDPVHGKICEDCGGGRYYKAVKNKCVKDSYLKSILTSLEMYLHHKILHIYENIDMIICESYFFKEKLKEMGFNKETVYLPNFYDIKAIDELNPYMEDEEDGSIIYVGRLAPEKGLSTLLDAANLLKREDRKIQIKMSGNGSLKEFLQERVRKEKIDNVRFLGHMSYSDLCREIRKSFAVVLPSECYENSPISVIEAFAMRKPVIGARTGGIPELIKDNETGLTFEPGNAVDLSTKIEYIAGNPDRAKTMGERARLFVEQEMNAEKYYRGLMEIYERAISFKS